MKFKVGDLISKSKNKELIYKIQKIYDPLKSNSESVYMDAIVVRSSIDGVEVGKIRKKLSLYHHSFDFGWKIVQPNGHPLTKIFK